jgi:hypothetical protein
MRTSKIKDIKAVVKREKQWSTMATKDARSNAASAKRSRKAGKTELAKDSEREVKLDKMFASKRKRIAIQEIKKLPKVPKITK